MLQHVPADVFHIHQLRFLDFHDGMPRADNCLCVESVQDVIRACLWPRKSVDRLVGAQWHNRVVSMALTQ